MASSSQESHFHEALSQEDLTEIEMAVAILWYETECLLGTELSASEIGRRLQDAGLTGRVNVTRLRQKLEKSRDTLRGKQDGTFRIAMKRKSTLDELYSPLLRQRKLRVSDDILPEGQTKGTRPYIEKLAYQINGCYESAFYDGCAVLCRRLLESLLIEAFDHAGHRGAIERNGDLEMFDAIIKKAKSGQYIKLARTAPGVLEKVKEIGDAAAHDRYHITTKQDVTEFQTGFRRVVSQLLALAGITTST